ncbi:MAG: hypothetical protein Q7R35_02540 [Elusimicrobiota bacterium]|nr:hypothetical protein [Elusimicrobiota bacterium]
MKTPLNCDLADLQKNIKVAYEESVRGNCKEVKDLLFDCLLILSKLNSATSTPKTKKHKWSADDEIVGFYLANKYSDTASFRKDHIAKRLIKARPTISMGSLQMLIQNFYHLMKKDKGLGSASKLAKEIHLKYRNQPLSNLQCLAEGALKKSEK